VTESCCSFFNGFVATLENPRLKIELKGRIIDLREEGMTPYEIVAKMKIPW
jgi:hypothetical protein